MNSLVKRIVTVLIGAPFVVAAILWPVSIVFKLFVIICLTAALFEFLTIVGLSPRERGFGLGLGILHMVYLLFGRDYFAYAYLEMTAVVLASFLFYCFSRKETVDGIGQKIAFTVLGVFYVATFGSFVGMIREQEHGVFWVFALLSMTWMNDTSAYFFGHKFGKRKLAPMISPGKTFEGFLGGFLGTFAGFVIFSLVFGQPVPWIYGIGLTLLVGTIGPVGDLCESLIKRSFKVKDSGNIIPGHGGMLDRIDALLFTAPVVYFFSQWLL